MTELLEKLKKIDHEIEGEEFTQYGATYFFAFDVLEGAADDLSILEKYFMELELSPPLNKISLMEIDDPQGNMNKIATQFHFAPEPSQLLCEIAKNERGYYKVCEDGDCLSRGNLMDIFRIIKDGKDMIVLWFYLCD